ARNTTPHIIVFHLTRLLLNSLRAINELVFALIFVSAVGLGPFAGVLAVALHATGMLAKFCAEEIEGVDKGQVEAQMAAGATRMQVILFGVTPQIIPQFIGYAIYRLDVSIRSATVLGFVGAGGLGFSLIQTMKLFKYHQTATCIFVIFLLVLISDWICGRLRRKVIWRSKERFHAAAAAHNCAHDFSRRLRRRQEEVGRASGGRPKADAGRKIRRRPAGAATGGRTEQGLDRGQGCAWQDVSRPQAI